MARKLGKLAPSNDPRTLRFSRYLDDAKLPPIPPMLDWGVRVTDWPMMKNDSVGDCTVAAAGHMLQCWSSNTALDPSGVVVPTDDEVIAVYSAVTGYSPADPNTDQGAVETDILNYWRNTGIAGHKLGAYAQIDPRHTRHLRAAIDLFGGVYTGLALPETAQTQHTWSIARAYGLNGPGAPGSWGGHAVPLVAYRPDPGQHGRYIFTCITWGERQDMTQSFVEAYMEECYVLIAPEWTDGTRAAPSGVDLATLTADVAAVR